MISTATRIEVGLHAAQRKKVKIVRAMIDEADYPATVEAAIRRRLGEHKWGKLKWNS